MAHIYVAGGQYGLVKVGRTNNISRRRGLLKKQFRHFGNELLNFRAIDDLTDNVAFGAENRLIRKVQGVFAPYAGREWFTGDFEEAVRAALIAADEAAFFPRLTFTPPTPEEIEAMRLKKIFWKEQSRLRMEAYAEGVKQRRELRALRAREIAARALAGFAPAASDF